MTTQVYDQILEELQVELDELERHIFDALQHNPEGLTRRELIYQVYGYVIHPDEDLGNNKHDRKIRIAIASMQDRLVPIVSSSGKAGYRLDTSKETAERMALEMDSRAAKLQDKARRIRRFHSIPMPVDFPEATEIPEQLRLI
jgi:Mg2+ and Co2+ transporter CorA